MPTYDVMGAGLGLQEIEADLFVLLPWLVGTAFLTLSCWLGVKQIVGWVEVGRAKAERKHELELVKAQHALPFKEAGRG